MENNQSLPPNQPQPISQSVDEVELEKRSGSKSVHLLVGLLIAGLSVSLVYLFLHNQQAKQQLEQTTSDGPAQEETTTSQWQRFSSKEYGLNFSFPPDFIVNEEKGWVGYPNNQSILTGYTVYWLGEDEGINRRWLHIEKLTNEHVASLIQPLLTLEVGEAYLSDAIPTSPVSYTRMPDIITVDGTTAFVFEAPEEWEIDGAFKKVIIPYNGEYFQVGMTNSKYNGRDIDYPSIFSQILSTFEFIDQEQSSIPDDWQTYNHALFSLRHPQHLTITESEQSGFFNFYSDSNSSNPIMSLDARQVGPLSDYDSVVAEALSEETSTVIFQKNLNNGIHIISTINSGFGEGRRINHAYFKAGNAAISIETINNLVDESTFNQILSTFEFLD